MTYEIKFKNSALKELKKLSPDIRKRVLRAIGQLKDNPRAGNTRQMVGSKSYRLRVGEYRVIYTIKNSELIIEIIRIRHRRDIYR